MKLKLGNVFVYLLLFLVTGFTVYITEQSMAAAPAAAPVPAPAAASTAKVPKKVEKKAEQKDKTRSVADTTSASATRKIDPSTDFTITEIDADIEQNLLSITFSAECEKNELNKLIKIYPKVWLDRYYTNESPNEYLFRARFKPGQVYNIFLPESATCKGLRYFKTVDTFKYPDMEPNVAFAEPGTVVERSGRQMLHVKITNVNEVFLQGLNMPVILAPFAGLEMKNNVVSQPTPSSLAKKAKKAQRRYGSAAPAAQSAQSAAVQAERNLQYAALKSALSAKLNELKPIIDANPALKDFAGDIAEESSIIPAGVKTNAPEVFSVPLNFNKGKGSITAVSMRNNHGDYESETGTRVLRITDIGLTYKLSDRSLLVWATSIKTGAPLPDVSLLAVAQPGKIAVPLGKTDKDGLLAVKDFDKLVNINLLKGQKSAQQALVKNVTFLLASSAADKTYVEVNRSKYVTPDWVQQASADEIAGRRSLKGHLFTERGIYRPGETVFYKATVREFKNSEVRPPVDLVPAINIKNSKGETVYQSSAKLNEFGTTNGSLVIKPYFTLGTYTLDMVMPGTNEHVSRTFQVQEFQPPRHFAEVRFKPVKKKDKRYKNLSKTTNFVDCEISGVYYAGGPVKNGKVRWKVYYNSTSFKKPKYKDYTFGSVSEKRDELIESGESVLDSAGKTHVNVPLNNDIASGVLGLKVVATVVDFDGKASTESAVYQEEPAYLVGISGHKGLINAGDSESLQVIVIDKAGNRVEKGRIVAEVLRKNYSYIRKRNENGDVYWTSSEVYNRDLKANITLEKGVGVFDFDFVYGGSFIIKFTYTSPDGRTSASSTDYDAQGGYYYGYDYNNRDRTFEKLNVIAERAEYAPGETIRVFVNPHRKISSLLMTIEREGVFESSVIKVSDKKHYVDIPVKKGYEPNVYVSFLGTVARGEFPEYNGAFDNDAPTFLFGVVNVDIKREPGELKVAISDEVENLRAEPGATVTLKLSSKNGEGAGVVTEMAVAVVDESVLNMTGFETPKLDLLGKFHAMLSVFTGDIRSDLLKQTPFHVIGNEEVTGGDGMPGRPEAATSKVRKDFNPVAYFNASVVTDKSGNASVSFKVPDTMTTYRVYAVTVDKGSKFASTQRSLLVVKDFYLEPGTPRFFTKGDKFKMYVSAFNKTKAAAPVQFTLAKDPLVEMRSPQLNYNVGSMDRTLMPVDGVALDTGVSRFNFSGKLGDKDDTVQISVPVRSGYVMMNDVVFGTLTGSAKIRYTMPEGTEKIDWKDAKAEAVTLTISGSPFLRLSPGLKYLLNYPYGCVEQTASRVLPLAGLRDLIKSGHIMGISVDDTDKFLNPGITRLLSMQTSSGGFGYWPGDMQPHKWGSIYAITALTTAKLAGADVPDQAMALAMTYLAGTIKDGSKDDRTYAGYAAYISALNKKLEQSVFQQMYNDIGSMPREGALLVVYAGYLSNHLNADKAAQQAKSILERKWDPDTNAYFHARYREPAISLIVASALLPGDQITGSIVSQLVGGISKDGIWSSTSDTGWSLVALGNYYKGVNFSGSNVKVSIRQEGWPETTVTLDPKKSYTYTIEPKSFLKKPEITISTPGAGALTYALNLTYPRVDYAKEGYSNGFRIKKMIENTSGAKTISVGDVVKVTIDIDADNYQTSIFVVLDDPLPAGFVAINSAIKTEEQVSKRKNRRVEYDEDGNAINDNADDNNSDEDDYYYRWYSWDYEGGFYRFTPSYFEIRDDRVLAFKNQVWHGRYQYTYYARAICEGEFVLPSTKIQLMYEPKVVSYTPEGKVIINELKNK